MVFTAHYLGQFQIGLLPLTTQRLHVLVESFGCCFELRSCIRVEPLETRFKEGIRQKRGDQLRLLIIASRE